MSKIKVFVTLNDKQKQKQVKNIYNGFLTPEKIVYKEEDKTVTIYRDSNTIKMVRREKESMVTLNFMCGKTKNSWLEIVGLQPFEFETKTTLLDMDETSIHICYQNKIEEEIMGDFDLKIQYEVIK